MNKVKIGIIGTGNIGTDLLLKIRRSEILECGIFAGRNPDSVGVKLAQEMGVPTTFESISYIEENPDCCEIVFDATSAKVHEYNAPILKRLKKFTLDLTPAHVGPFCVPVVNLDEALESDNVNMITCGGQATVPLAYTIAKVHPDTKYLEVVATISSKSAGAGTRNNIDEFTQTTGDALAQFSGIKNTKAIITLNPAEPPITMRNTVYAMIENPDIEALSREIHLMEKRIQKYVPGYQVIVGPVFESGRVTTTVEVMGSGDFLPKYSGNLDIITCAAIEIAEEYARKKLLKGE
ncbi:MAG: acetaldehyde dehydrogenase (acetylating) [Oscillospiraceae bacterium]|nr:acetaldehyde dehydrogenase (acetylating) [Oscillospiraceae bacterium]